MSNGNLSFLMNETTKYKVLTFWGPPFILFVLLAISFGSMLPFLGYGFDEWHFIYYSTRGSQGLYELFHYDGHPQATWSYIQSFDMLGYNPLYWHFFSLLLRWLAVLSFWLCLIRIWPNNHRQNFFASALFAIHPIFTLQVFPISFFEVWVGYLLLFLSFYFTILAIQNPKKHQIFTIIAVIFTVVHVFTREYAWFVELMRPAFIWIALPPNKDLINKKIFQVTKVWFPFLAIFMSSLIWRGFFYTPLRKHFQVQSDLFTNPGNTLISWLMDLIPDVSIVLFTSWYETFKSEYLYLARPLNIALLILMMVISIFGKAYIQKIDNLSKDSDHWVIQAVFLGLPSILFGILPFYIASYSLHLTDTPHNSRLAIGMLPGAALISSVIIENVISRQKLRVLITAIILSLSVGWHIRYTNDFRKVWTYQSDFLQQLTWRIPGIEKNTAIFVWQDSLPDIDNSTAGIALYGDFALSMAINSIYEPSPIPTESKLSYWYYYLSGVPANITQNIQLNSEHATTSFNGSVSDSLFFYYDPGNNRCLHLIGREDQYYNQYPDAVKELSSYTDADRILATTRQNVKLRDEIFGGNEQSWCYYYQKAELAQQYQQWHKISLLWNEATDNNLQPSFGTEYIPFIDGFAHLDEWQKSKEITITANKLSKAMYSILCPLWDNIEQSTYSSEEKDETIRQIRIILECSNN